MSKRKKAAITATCAIIVLVAGLALATPSCSSDDDGAAENIAAEKPVTTGKDTGKDSVTAKSTVDSDAAKESTNNGSNGEAAKPDATEPVDAPQPSGGSSSGSGSEPSPAPSKRWVPDYKDVWVEDSAAWDEQVPIYDYVEISVCNVCGADISGNEVAHTKAHALAGEGGGHHNDFRSAITGYETVHHDAVGHWETVENGGHWE